MTTTTQLLATPMPTVLNINSFSQPNLMYNNGFLNQNSGMRLPESQFCLRPGAFGTWFLRAVAC